ncbi:MAG: glycine zipper 2TM domain-containing protein, partial [Gammaproteobacteria bacterium]|nr:glycine zipper 2TM domain-containing protein [Gammaproteobacteria bacterium]
MPQTILITLLLALSLSLSGCARSLSGSTYPRSDARQVQQAQMGTVQHVRQVQIEGTDSKIGAVAGGIAGGIAGSSVGGGKGQDIATVAGVIVGGIAGSAAEELGTRQLG